MTGLSLAFLDRSVMEPVLSGLSTKADCGGRMRRAISGADLRGVVGDTYDGDAICSSRRLLETIVHNHDWRPHNLKVGCTRARREILDRIVPRVGVFCAQWEAGNDVPYQRMDCGEMDVRPHAACMRITHLGSSERTNAAASPACSNSMSSN